MKRLPNPALDRLILNHLVEKYKLKQPREEIHLSTLIYCLTRSFFDQIAPVEPTDEEVMLWALGYGLQDVLTPAAATTPIFEEDGIIFRPDMVFELGNFLVELKTTRQSLKRAKEALPETWIEYIMGGCHIRNINQYELSGLYMMGSYAPPFPEIYSETLIFEQEELDDNWSYILGRKKVYETALALNEPPTPFMYCKEWECRNCRYKLQCDALTMLAKEESNEPIRKNKEKSR